MGSRTTFVTAADYASEAHSDFEAEIPELLQCLGIAPGVIHRVVGVLRDTILFPLRRLGCVLD